MWRRELGRFVGNPQVRQNGLDGGGLDDRCNDRPGAATQPLQRWRVSAIATVADTVTAGFHIDAKHSGEQLSPAFWARG